MNIKQRLIDVRNGELITPVLHEIQELLPPKELDDFIKYWKKYPEQRFWQALRNYCGVAFIYTGDTLKGKDTFYKRGVK